MDVGRAGQGSLRLGTLASSAPARWGPGGWWLRWSSPYSSSSSGSSSRGGRYAPPSSSSSSSSSFCASAIRDTDQGACVRDR
eukprot:906496-Rhodomonas_salina.5